MGIAIQSDFQLAEGSSLDLVSVLQLFNPVGFFALQTSNFTFNGHTLFIFFINFANKL